MTTPVSIRYATPEDINTIGFLAQQTWPIAYGSILSGDKIDYMLKLFYQPSSLVKQMLELKHSFILVEEEEEPLGFASFSPLPENGAYRIHKLYILPGKQGKGLGKAMIDYIQEAIQPLGASVLRVNVYRKNAAKVFYERLGFSVISEEDIDIGNGYFMNDYVMEKKI